MKAKYKKSIILASSALSLMIGAAIVLSSNENLFSIMMRVKGTDQPYSITFDTSSNKSSSAAATSGYYNNVFTTTSSSGIQFTMTMLNSYYEADNSYMGKVTNITEITFSQTYQYTDTRTFQKISSISITSASNFARTIDLHFNGAASADAALSVPGNSTANYNVATSYVGTARSLTLKGHSDLTTTKTINLTAITISFTCNPDYDEPKAMTGITLDTSEAITQFDVGDSFDSTGVVVTAHYSDGTSADVSASATFSGYNMSTRGNQTVTVSYTEAEATKTATYGINVHQDVNHIAISGQTTSFTEGDEFDIGNGIVTAYYDALETDYDVVTDSATFSPFNIGDELEASDDGTTITVSFGGKTTTYEISVHADSGLTGYYYQATTSTSYVIVDLDNLIYRYVSTNQWTPKDITYHILISNVSVDGTGKTTFHISLDASQSSYNSNFSGYNIFNGNDNLTNTTPVISADGNTLTLDRYYSSSSTGNSKSGTLSLTKTARP